jgi:uncharacterized membrane protein YidH (DUF202 family)
MNKPYKAVAAAVLTFLGTLLASIQGRKEFDELTVLEWLIVFGSAAVATLGVYVVDNNPTAYRRRGDLGQNVLYLALVVLVVLAIVFLVLGRA